MPKQNKRGHGEGSIRMRKDGTCEARYTIGRKKDGKPNRISIYGKDPKEVKAKLIDKLDSLNKGTYIEPKKITVGQWLDTWFKEYVRPTAKDSTSKGYQDIINIHLKTHIGTIPLQKLTPEDVQCMVNDIHKQIPKKAQTKINNLIKKMEKASVEEKIHYHNEIKELEKKRISARTISHIVVMLGTCLQQALKNDYVNKNVAKLIATPKVEPTEIEVLSLDEQIRFMGKINLHRLGFPLQFCLATGLRQSELLGLRWQDVDIANGTISIRNTLMRQRNFEEDAVKKTKMKEGTPKTTKSKRDIPLPGPILIKLKNHRDVTQPQEKEAAGDAWVNTGYVFTSEIGTPVEPRKLLTIYHKILAAAGITQKGIHSLRHTFATRAIKAGMEVKTLSELLGHEDIATTLNLYVHSCDDEKKIQMQKLNQFFT